MMRAPDASGAVSRPAGVAPLLVGFVGVVAGALLALWGGSMLLAPDFADVAVGERPSNPVIVVVAGAIVGIATPLVAIGWYLRRHAPVPRRPHRTQALWIGLAWGTIAMLLAGVLNSIAGAFPASAIYPGFIEELLKLLVPVILLAASSSYRSPRLGAWLVFVTAAWFALLEGISYIITAMVPVLDVEEVPSDAAFITTMDVIVRVIAAVSHPLMTVGAAIVIWLVAATLPKARALAVGVLAYLGAALIHGLNDAVLAGPVRDWSVPISIALTAVYVVAIFVLWFRPQVLRVQRRSDEGAVVAPRAA